MQFYCEKYREALVGSRLACRHPKEYCKFRSACLAHFMGKEEESEQQKERPDSTCADNRQNESGTKEER